MARRKQHKYIITRPESQDANIIAFEQQACKSCSHTRTMVRDSVKGIDPTPRDMFLSMDNVKEYGLTEAPCPVTPEWLEQRSLALAYRTQASIAYQRSIAIMEGRELADRRNTL